jgi:hypothetical protein
MRSWILASVVVSVSVAGVAWGEVETEPIGNLRLRGEGFDTPSADATKESSYGFFNARLRGGVDVKWNHWMFHGVIQAAGSLELPENGAFAIGPVYTSANGGETNPGRVSLLELSAAYRTSTFYAVLGRQKYAEGMEAKTGIPYLDAVKKRRLAERLIGNWDWVNVGRRYDGLAIGMEDDDRKLDAYVLRPLAGGVNYKDAHEWLDDLTVVGLTVTGKYDRLISSSDLRLFGIYYDDSRPGAIDAMGNDIRITTLGASVLAGNEGNDLLAWFAYQLGDWRAEDHKAWAFIVEAGHFYDFGHGGKIRAGYAHSTGNDNPADDNHRSFYNLLPTNHKFYGSMDYSAFSNLRDVYVILAWSFAEKWSARTALHAFFLTNKTDAWYGGSGPFNESLLGYVGRRPAGGGDFSSYRLGQELDLDVNWSFHTKHKLQAGGGVFWGDKARQDTGAIFNWCSGSSRSRR